MQNRVVARYLDGRTLKGQTADFLPTKSVFHVIPSPQAGTSIQVVEVKLADLKAVFFVKTWSAMPLTTSPGRSRRTSARRGARCRWSYQPDRPGFFVAPVDPKSNNDRCFVVMAAVKAVTFL